MPIFHDQHDHHQQEQRNAGRDVHELTRTIFAGQHSRPSSRERRGSETSTIALSDVQATSGLEGRAGAALTRGQLIERIKRTKSPVSIPHSPTQGFAPLASHTRPDSPARLTSPNKLLRDLPRTPTREDSPKSVALRPASREGQNALKTDDTADNGEIGLQIERPRSALHSGDFRPEKQKSREANDPGQSQISTSPVVPWHRDFPRSGFPRFQSPSHSHPNLRPAGRSRAVSQTSLSNVVLMPTTSPLVHTSNNTDLEDNGSRPGSRSPDRQTRRHTFSPRSFHSFRHKGDLHLEHLSSQSSGHIPALRREGTYPYQAHQPRRSLHNFSTSFSSFDPQTPWLRSRKSSVSGESSPIQHAPMVGSYEESILRGRMSTTPSRPLNFLAQIGVLGRGNSKGNPKCPPHVAVPFPAVFYSYGLGSGRISDDSPSPYVGLIDLENSLSPPEEKRDRRHQRGSAAQKLEQRSRSSSGPRLQQEVSRRKEKQKRQSRSPKAPPGGCYRIPQQGQLQIVIKNPNKTAVKLFLVPYDLSDMEPGQKTFIRQRSYSAGPIIDMPMSLRRNLGTDRPEAAISNSDDPNDRPVLRYLIHLHICCPCKGRYYLYKSVRVVFANRVPDGKEKLRNEIQLPEPRYSTYKPSRDSIASINPSILSTPASDKIFRRRSLGVGLGSFAYDTIDAAAGYLPTDVYPAFAEIDNSSDSSMTSPFVFPRADMLQSRPTSRQEVERMDLDPESPSSRSFSRHIINHQHRHTPRCFDAVADAAPTTLSALPFGDSLLAQRLRSLEVQRDASGSTNNQPSASP